MVRASIEGFRFYSRSGLDSFTSEQINPELRAHGSGAGWNRSASSRFDDELPSHGTLVLFGGSILLYILRARREAEK
jgi:hypothetical protein